MSSVSSTISTLPEDLCILIFKNLSSYRDVCECSKVCRRWKELADSETVWGLMIQRSLIDTERHVGVHEHNKQTFAEWATQYRGFTENYTRMRRAMRKLERWSQEQSPQLFRSLAPGLKWMGSESIPVRELLLVVTDSEAMRDFLIAYHLHDGQRRLYKFLAYGLFGSYQCYGSECSLTWLPSRMLQITRMYQFNMVVFAWCNQTMNYLGIVVDCPKSYKPQVLHHVVQIQPQSLRIVDKGLFGDFFTSYVDSLACGYHDIVNGAISMMPNTGPNTCTSMSHGIRTTVSVMFCTDETPRFRVYRYQVSFEIVDPENFEYKSVQLTERYWLIHYDGGRYVESGGPGVVGEFPILTKDQPYYRYCSRIQDEDDDVPVLALEGFFKWVPGTIEEPLGVEITLPVPFVEMPMPLEIL